MGRKSQTYWCLSFPFPFVSQIRLSLSLLTLGIFGCTLHLLPFKKSICHPNSGGEGQGRHMAAKLICTRVWAARKVALELLINQADDKGKIKRRWVLRQLSSQGTQTSISICPGWATLHELGSCAPYVSLFPSLSSLQSCLKKRCQVGVSEVQQV